MTSVVPRAIVLGWLEALVIDCLWQSDEAMSVCNVGPRIKGPSAYTTTMTTLDHLFKKNLARHEPQDRAYFYRAQLSRNAPGVRALATAVSDIDVGTKSRDPDSRESFDRPMLALEISETQLGLTSQPGNGISGRVDFGLAKGSV